MNINDIITKYSDGIDEIVNSINISKITSNDIDKLFKKIYNTSIALVELEALCYELELSYKNKYNYHYINPQMDKQKPTVAELTAYAEEMVSADKTEYDVHMMAYKSVKNKLSNAKELLDICVKMLLNSDMQCNSRILNEVVK